MEKSQTRNQLGEPWTADDKYDFPHATVLTCLDLSFLRKRGATKSSGWRSLGDVMMEDTGAGCCMLRNTWMDDFSASYAVLSAIVLFLDARRNAAIQLEYCSSCGDGACQGKVIPTGFMLVKPGH